MIWKIPIASDKLRWIKFLSERSPLHNSNKNKEQGRLALHHHCQGHFLASYECLILQVTCSVSSIFRFQFKSCFKIYCIFLDLFSHWKPHFISFCLNKDNEYTTIWCLFSIFFALRQGLIDSFLMLSRNIRSVKQSLFVKVEKLKKIIGTDITYDKHEIMVTVNVTPMRDNPQPT